MKPIKGRIQQLREDEPELFNKLARLHPLYLQRPPNKPQEEPVGGWLYEALNSYVESGDSLTAEEVLAKLKENY
jgi:hypothetical protein